MKIEKNIALPEKQTVKNVSKEMEFGDSVFFADKKKARSFMANARSVHAGTDSHFTSRPENGGIRVWKIQRNS